MAFEKPKFSIILCGLEKAIKMTAMIHASFREHIKKKDVTIQIHLEDKSQARNFIFKSGKVTSKRGIHTMYDFTKTYVPYEMELC